MKFIFLDLQKCERFWLHLAVESQDWQVGVNRLILKFVQSEQNTLHVCILKKKVISQHATTSNVPFQYK